jgi:hypothetical protein
MSGRLRNPGLRFWLHYAETEGALWEPAGDSVLVVLPPRLRERHDLPDELIVTADPDVAREDGATLLDAGHPVLAQAADRVIARGDVGHIRLPRPAAPAPDTDTLLAAARDQFPVDHGRIDASGGVVPAMRAVLRAGALATLVVSTDEHFQEELECWVDVPSRLVLAAPVADRLGHLAHETTERPGGARPDDAALAAAVSAAHAHLEGLATARQAALVRQAGDAHAREVERARAYYAEALGALERRLGTATPDRAAALRARMDATQAERERRIAEIGEKHRPRHVIRPFRLHLVQVPVLRLPVDIRRGERRFPLALDWLVPAGTFAGLRCPHCAEPAPLVASKARLGCRRCLAPAAPPARPPSAPTAPAKPKTPAAQRPAPAPAASTRSARPRPPLAPPPPPLPSAGAVRKSGEKLVGTLWQAIVSGDRRLGRAYAPESPAGALHQLFRAAGPLHVLTGGDPDLRSFSSSASEPLEADPTRFRITGELRTGHHAHAYSLVWGYHDGTALVEELTPYPFAPWPYLPDTRTGRLFGSRRSADLPAPLVTLDRVARALWNRTLPATDLPVLLRCLAAWWRLPDRAGLQQRHDRSAIAAALHRAVIYRAGVAQSTYAAAAATYAIDPATVRAAGTDLQQRLKLRATTVW